MQCVNFEVPSLAYPGGYAESIVAPATALARIPDALSFVEAAPMGCAGVTTFNALRRTAAVAGDLVAVLGIGGSRTSRCSVGKGDGVRDRRDRTGHR